MNQLDYPLTKSWVLVKKNTVGDLDIGYKLKTIEKQQMRIVFMQSIHTSKYCLTEDLDLKTQMKSNFGFSMKISTTAVLIYP